MDVIIFVLMMILLATSELANGLSSVKSIFILAGETNMAGRGGLEGNRWDGVIPFECQPNPSILRLSAELNWVEAREPLHIDIDVNSTCGVGPGMSFANALLNYDRGIGAIGLVPCAVGGTKITQWARGSWLYNRMITRTNAALQSGGTVRGILWYQGESDAVDEEDSLSYFDNLVNFFKQIREDLKQPDLPIIQVALAASTAPFTENVRKAQLGVYLKRVKCVDAAVLPTVDKLHGHLTTQAHVQLGQMLASEFVKIY